MARSTYLKNALLNTLRGVAFSVSNIYVGLLTMSAEVSGGGYARQAPTFPAASGGSMATTADATFPQASANWGDIAKFAFFDALTSGNTLHTEYMGGYAWRPFTGDAASNVISSPGHGYSNGDRAVLIAETASLPGGLAADTLYYIINAATDTFKLSATSGGSEIDVTSNGAGAVKKVVLVTINSGDQFRFPSGQLSMTENDA
jgi:hypothetical protein